MGIQELIHLAGRTGARGDRRHGCTSFDSQRRCGELRMTPRKATMVLLLFFSLAHRGGLVADRLH
ncbi:hypothetical protein AWT69_004938 [Pseudomonas putida]|nr:hypothetical protein AWT69_004938 [Pseudomonas putida]